MTATDTTNLLEVRDLRRTFAVRGAHGGHEELVALDGVSFDLEAGGALAVVGESGSGKTTAARIVAGLERPTAGAVAIDGAPRTDWNPGRAERKRRARQVQMVFQDPYGSLDPRQTVGAALREVLAEHEHDDDGDRDARVAALLDQVGLDAHHATVRPRRLSGGQRQRVAIARALAVRPRLLILDEAVAALDVSVQAQIIHLLADLRAQLGIAYLFVSHDLAVVRQVTDDCVVMHRGRIVEAGRTEDVLDRPQADYTQRLLSAIPRPGWRPRRAVRSDMYKKVSDA